MSPAVPTHRLTILPQGVRVPVRASETMLAAICRAGFTYPFGCRRGGCGACRVRVVAGEVSYERPVDASVLADTDRAGGSWLSCRAVLHSDVTIAMPSGDDLKRVVPFDLGHAYHAAH